MIHDILSFYIVVINCEEWKAQAFLWSAPYDSQHRYATVVEHAVGYYLAGSKCKPNSCKKVYYSNRPKYFSLRQQGNHGQNFKDLFCTGEQVWMDETSYNFSFQISK